MLPRVHRITSKAGGVNKYHRITRAALPCDVPEDSREFMTAWLAEEAKTPTKSKRPPRGTVAHGCEAFLTSAAYRALNTGYSRVMLAHVNAIAKRGGNALLQDLEPRHVRADLEPLSPAVASTRRKAWRKLAEFWETSGMTAINVADGVRRKKLPKTDGFIEWSIADVAAFRARWPIGTAQRLAMELLQWTGARCIDAVTLGPQKIGRDGVLTFRQSKTGVEAYVPWHGPAFGLEAQRTDLHACTSDRTALIWTLTEFGKARTVAGFSQWFSRAATEAGLPHLSAHGLRKYRMNQLAESGVPLLAMQAWVGHTTLSEVQHYTARADRKKAITGTKVVKLGL